MQPNQTYEHDLDMAIDDTSYNGVALVPYKDKYVIQVAGEDNIDFLSVSNCHQRQSPSVSAKGWGPFKNRRTYSWEYVPNEIEKKVGCHVDIAAINKDNKTTAFGFIDFIHPSLSMVATILCNGKKQTLKGLSMCETLRGLEQKISFEAPVTVIEKKGCPALTSTDRMNFTYKIPDGYCQYGFFDSAGNIHRHVTYGYLGIKP